MAVNVLTPDMPVIFADTVYSPATLPSRNVACATPSELVVVVAGVTVAPVLLVGCVATVNVTSIPNIGLPFWSFTLRENGFAKS